MNKLFIVLLLCSLIGSMVAMTDMVSANMNAFRIDSKSVNKMQISFQIPDFTIGEEYAGGNTYHRINIDGAGQLLEPGMPELPPGSEYPGQDIRPNNSLSCSKLFR